MREIRAKETRDCARMAIRAFDECSDDRSKKSSFD